jgi:hypothetical protein
MGSCRSRRSGSSTKESPIGSRLPFLRSVGVSLGSLPGCRPFLRAFSSPGLIRLPIREAYTSSCSPFEPLPPRARLRWAGTRIVPLERPRMEMTRPGDESEEIPRTTSPCWTCRTTTRPGSPRGLGGSRRAGCWQPVDPLAKWLDNAMAGESRPFAPNLNVFERGRPDPGG